MSLENVRVADVTGEGMNGGCHRRRHEWGTSLKKARVGDVTGGRMSEGRHWRMYEWGTSLENV